MLPLMETTEHLVKINAIYSHSVRLCNAVNNWKIIVKGHLQKQKTVGVAVIYCSNTATSIFI